MVNEFIILNDIELVFVANVGDLGDQPFRIRADGAENFTLNNGL